MGSRSSSIAIWQNGWRCVVYEGVLDIPGDTLGRHIVRRPVVTFQSDRNVGGLTTPKAESVSQLESE